MHQEAAGLPHARAGCRATSLDNTMLPASRHVISQYQQGKPSFCVILESTGTAGGSALLWTLANDCCKDARTQRLFGCLALESASTARARCVKNQWPDEISYVQMRWVEYQVGANDHTFRHVMSEALSGSPPAASLPGQAREKGRQLCLIDDLSLIIMCEGIQTVLQTIEAMLSASPPVAVAAVVRPQLHATHVVEILRSVATCEVELTPADRLQADLFASRTGCLAHVAVETCELRHSGAMPETACSCFC
jgi:hypothetical protein